MPNGVRFLSNIAKVSPLSDTPVKQQKQKEKNGKKYGKNARIRFKTQPSKEKKTEPPLQLRQEHAGWLHGASERSDIAKGLVPVYDIPALPEA